LRASSESPAAAIGLKLRAVTSATLLGIGISSHCL
jgi:hypothetical protein